MNVLQKQPNGLPASITLENPRFVPQMTMTTELKCVAREVINQWRNRNLFKGLLKYGIRPLDRLLFFGPPGNGKTLACAWIAKELELPMYRVLCNQLRDCYLGNTSKNVAEVMGFLASQKMPALCLWDEVESIFVDRRAAEGKGAQEYGAALTVFLQELDRWQAPILLVMATNIVESLDAALLSRIELQLEFMGPTPDQARQTIQYWSELLHEYGGAEWGATITRRAEETPPVSFRELQQQIACAAREWTVRQLKN